MVEKANFTVIGDLTIHCAGCEQRVRNALQRLPGVQEVEASSETQRVEVGYDPALVDPGQVATRLEEIGYQVDREGAAR